jgi:hypothetical protein
MAFRSVYWFELDADFQVVSLSDSVRVDFFSNAKGKGIAFFSSDYLNLYKNAFRELVERKGKRCSFQKKIHFVNDELIEIQWICFKNRNEDPNGGTVFFLGLVDADVFDELNLDCSKPKGFDAKWKADSTGKNDGGLDLVTRINELTTLCSLIDLGFPVSDVFLLHTEKLANSLVNSGNDSFSAHSAIGME